MRVYELARELDQPSRELIERLHALGFDGVTTASSNVPVDAVPLLPTAATRDPDVPDLEPEAVEPTSLVDARSEDHPPAPRSIARRLVMIALWTVFGLGAGFVLAITLPYLQGNRSLTVLSGSMEPEIRTGDVVVVEQIAPLDARLGDIVSFRDPDDPSRLITHRVRAMEVSDNEVEFVTKGDANTAVEQWRITPDGQIGRVVFRVPKIGYVLFYLRGSLGRMILIVLPALLLGAYELWRIWRPSADDPDGERIGDAGEGPAEAAG